MLRYLQNGITLVFCTGKEKETFAEMVQMFNEAWLLVKGHLTNHGM